MLLRFLMVGAVVTLGFELNPPTGNDLARWADQAQTWCNARVVQLQQLPEQIAAIRPAQDPVNATEVSDAPTTSVAAAAVVADVPAPDADSVFASVMNETVASFVADLGPAPTADTALLAATPAPEVLVPPLSEPVAPAPEPIAPPAEDLYPGLAFELNHVAEGLNIIAPAFPMSLPEQVFVSEPASPTSHEEWNLATTSQVPDEVPVAVVEVTTEEAAAATAEVAVEPAKETRTERFSAAVRLTGQALHAWMSVLQAPRIAYSEPTDAISR